MKSQFAKYVALNVIGMAGISFYILADTFFISQALGSSGLAALNFSLAVYSVMHGIGLMTGIGGAARRSILLSLGKKEEADSVLMNSLYIGAFAALLLMVAGSFFSTEISLLLGADEETLAHSETYMSTMLCFSPCFLLNNILVAFIRNDGNPKICMAAMLISSLSNILLDYIFIFTFSMGMYGAVFATGLSPVISLAILSTHLRSAENTLLIRRLGFDFRKAMSLCKLGVSSFITEFSSAVTVVAFNLVMLKINGNIGVAAYGIVANVMLVASSVFSGISQGVQPLASSSYGKRDRKALAELLRYTLITVSVTSIMLFLTVFLAAEPIANAFNGENDPILREIAVNGLRLYFTGFLFAGINIVMSAFFSAVDSPAKASVVSLLRSAVIIVPLLILMSIILKINGVWLSFAATEFIAFAASVVSIIKSGILCEAGTGKSSGT